MSHGVSLDMSLLIALPEKLNAAIQIAVDKTLDQTKAIAKDYAHVITGSMQAGVYTSSATGSDYQQAVSAAVSLNPKAEILPEVPQPPPGEGTLSDAVAHSLFEEYGTVTRSAHPFMTPAAIEGEKLYVTNLENAIRELES